MDLEGEGEADSQYGEEGKTFAMEVRKYGTSCIDEVKERDEHHREYYKYEVPKQVFCSTLKVEYEHIRPHPAIVCLSGSKRHLQDSAVSSSRSQYSGWTILR